MSQSSPFPSCFRPSSADADPDHPPPPPTTTGKPNLTTCFYQTQVGVFSLTWSRTFLSHSLHLHLLPIDQHTTNNNNTCSPLSLSHPFPPHQSAISFHLQINPFLFWKKHGSKTLTNPDATPGPHIFWDLSRAKFSSSGPEPQSGFYIAVVVNREIVLLVGDLTKEACGKTKSIRPRERIQSMVLRREQVFGNKVYTTKARFGGGNRHISIDCSVGGDARLSFSVDNKKVLQIKRLKWKFRGNERIEVDGIPIQISWDVYNWLFEDGGGDAHAVFMFRFEEPEEEEEECDYEGGAATPTEKSGGVVVPWRAAQEQQSSYSSWRKMKKGLMMRTAGGSSSWSSVSMSSASSMGTNSSVMEWASVEESELSSGPTGFSLLVYAWKK
ncbi:hypothetical protein LINPERPRIM_LOCUS33450 [Linum perenne]